MNFRQIQLLNTLETKIALLEENISLLKSQNKELINAVSVFEIRVCELELSVNKLENPPKRPRGRPRKDAQVN